MSNVAVPEKNEAVRVAVKRNMYILLLPNKAVEHKSTDVRKGKDILITQAGGAANQSLLMRSLGLHPSYTLSI